MRFLHASKQKQNCHSEVDELKLVFDKFEMSKTTFAMTMALFL